MQEVVIAMLLRQPRFGFTLSFQDHMMPHMAAILDGCLIPIWLLNNKQYNKLCQIKLFLR